MENRRLILIGVAALLLLAVWQLLPSLPKLQRAPEPVVGDVPASEAKDYTFDVTGGARLDFAEVAGNITIIASPSGPMKVTVTKRSFGTDEPSALREVQSFDVKPRRQGNTIYFGLGAAARPRRQVDYKISTPPDVSLRVASGSGSVTVTGLRGAIDITGDNVSVMLTDNRGPISIQNKTGDLRVSNSVGKTSIRSPLSTVQLDHLTAETLVVETGSNTVIRDSGSDSTATFKIGQGDLTLTRFRAKTLLAEVTKGQITMNESEAEQMDLNTQAGKINLLRVGAGRLRATTTTGQLTMDQTQGDFDLKTQSGTVTLSEVGAAGLHIAAGAGNVTFYGSLPRDGEQSIQTSSGDISVYVVKESAFRLDATTTRAITIDPPFVLEQAERKPGHWRGVINQGTMQLTLKSASGDVLISSQQPF